MGSFVGSSQIGAHLVEAFATGLDLRQSRLPDVLGEYTAAEAATFRPGQFLMFDSNMELTLSDGNNLAGMAKYGKAVALNSLVVDQPISFTSGGTADLGHVNISNLAIRSAANNGGTQYAVTTDYTVSLTTGIITHVPAGSGGSIPVSTTVYATYTRALSLSELAAQGTNWQGGYDDVTLADRKIALVTGSCRVFTAEFDTSRQYALSGTGSNLYVNASGILTNLSTSARFVGHVIQLPRAEYPFLGAQLDLNVAAAT